MRIVFDYRKLNAITKKQLWTLPSSDELFEEFKDKNYTTSLDLKGGHGHTLIKKEDRHKTSFTFN